MTAYTVDTTLPVTETYSGAGQPHRVCQLSTGRLIAFVEDATGSEFEFRYSDNNGQTWSALTGNLTIGAGAHPGAALVCTHADDLLFMAGNNNGALYYGTISGTTITWDTGDSHGLNPTDPNPYPFDLVGWRTGSTVYACRLWYAANNERIYLTFDYRPDTPGNWVHDEYRQVVAYNTYCGGTIDFHHTGDGRTVQGGTPHIYGMVFYGTTHTYFKATWSSTLWTVATAAKPSGWIGVPTPNTLPPDKPPVVAFDGTRIVCVQVKSSAPYVVCAERDIANTTWTERTVPSIATHSGQPRHVSVTVDPASGDFVIGAISNTDDDFFTIYYDRSAGSFGSWTEQQALATQSWHAMNRQAFDLQHAAALVSDEGGAGNPALYIVTDSFNSNPTAPTMDAPTDGSTQDVALSLLIDWTFNDPDAGDTQSAYTLRRRIGAGAYNYWNGTSWQASEDASTKIATSTTQQTLAASWGADGDSDHYYSVKTWDALDAGPSPWSSEVRVVPSAKDNPTITAPLTTVSDPSTTVTWTVASQTKYRVRVATDFVFANIEYDSGIVVSATTSHLTSFPTQGARWIEVTTWNDEGLQSTPDSEDVTVTYDVPPTPTLTATSDSPVAGAIRVVIDNGTPGVGEDPATSNDVYRREGDDADTEQRIAVGVANDGTYDDYTPASGVVYKYKIRAWAAIGTYTDGAWTA